MRLTFIAAAGVTALLATSALTGLAQAQDRLRPVGSVTYDPEPAGPEKGVYNIRPEDRRIRALRILAENGSADVRSLRVVYADGEEETVRVRQTLREGERTALFQLEEVRPIRSVEVTYIPRGGVTLVLLAEGRRGGEEPPPPPQPRPAEWVDLGCSNVSFSPDHDTITVRSSQRFSALRLVSKNFDVEVDNMIVKTARGNRDTYRIRQVIPGRSRTSAIELGEQPRRLAEVELFYRTRIVSTEKTVMCVEGLSNSRDED